MTAQVLYTYTRVHTHNTACYMSRICLYTRSIRTATHEVVNIISYGRGKFTALSKKNM